jgi:PBP1b-binding outer membrane lipoprotein LpoB
MKFLILLLSVFLLTSCVPVDTSSEKKDKKEVKVKG